MKAKVLFQTRSDLFDNFGGDTVQILRTKSELEALGLEIQISFDPSQDVGGFDIVHVFNLLRSSEALLFIRNARSQNKPVALSPIYWNTSEFEEKGRFIPPWRPRPRLTTAATQARERLSSLRETHERSCRKLALTLSDIVFPLAEAERSLLINDFDLGDHRFHIVHNGADLPGQPTGSRCGEQFGSLGDFVLCPGRIEDRKNQLGLIMAMRGSGLKTVIIGAAPNSDYFYACQEAADHNVVFLPQMPGNELMGAYKAARVVATPSWFEVAALVNLEAGLSGCHIATTDRSSAPEYFGELASYCDPSDIDSIRRSVFQEYERPRDGALRRFISDNYTWRRAAEQTVAAYEALLSGGRRSIPKGEEERALGELALIADDLEMLESLLSTKVGTAVRDCTDRPDLSRFAGLRHQVYHRTRRLMDAAAAKTGEGVIAHLSRSLAAILLARELLSYDRAYYGALITVENPPERMRPGRCYWLKFVIQNTGGLTWGAAGLCANPVNLAYRWRDSEGRLVIADGLRTPLPFDLAAGREIHLLATVVAPTDPGLYTLELHLVHESAAWFEEKGLAPVRLNVLVCE
ncbi:MAG: glycosyltransferase [Chloroflexi bacterium]|nr:glycosyltransferase [Chloroflexota bacterium]